MKKLLAALLLVPALAFGQTKIFLPTHADAHELLHSKSEVSQQIIFNYIEGIVQALVQANVICPPPGVKRSLFTEKAVEVAVGYYLKPEAAREENVLVVVALTNALVKETACTKR